MHPDICTNGPSLPRHIPVGTAKVAPIALTARTFKLRKYGIENPERSVLISGIPDPAAIYMLLPWGGEASLDVSGLYTRWSPTPGAAAGSEAFVVIVSPLLMSPNSSAEAL